MDELAQPGHIPLPLTLQHLLDLRLAEHRPNGLIFTSLPSTDTFLSILLVYLLLIMSPLDSEQVPDYR